MASKRSGGDSRDQPLLLAAISAGDLNRLHLKHGDALFSQPTSDAIKSDIMACAKSPDWLGRPN